MNSVLLIFDHLSYLSGTQTQGSAPAMWQKQQEYLKHRYTNYNSCEKPCTEVDIQTTLVSKSESSNPRLMFMFGKTIDVSREVLAYTPFNLVAELGGYLGLTLGFSFLDISLPFGLIWQKLMDCKTRWIQCWWCCDTALRWTEQKNAW